MSKNSKQRRDRTKARDHGSRHTGDGNGGGRTTRRKGTTKGHVLRLFMLYVVVFGTGGAFVGLMGGDDLPGGGILLWIILAAVFLAAAIATFVHARSGIRSSIDHMADKW